jgi:diguanylate cyclase (GGDEF)-like protein/PAS domain S-box-containing protein
MRNKPLPSPPFAIPHPPPLADALELAANAIFLADREGRIVWANRAFSELTGYALEEVIRADTSFVKSGLQDEAFYADLWREILSGHAWRGMTTNRRKDGSLYTVDQTITPLRSADGAITHFIAIQNDITLQRESSEQERYLAYHDPLTGLANRRYFLDLQRGALLHAQRSNALVALLFIDLDRFKPVNDVLGHDIGDRVLCAVSKRLTASVRRSDTVARVGGDEFTILLPDLASREDAVMLATKVVAAISRPFIIDGHRVDIGASVGIAFYPFDGENPDELMRKADQAMYVAKNQGGGSYRLFPAAS